MYINIYYWRNPRFEGETEGDFEGEESAKTMPEALAKALMFLDSNRGKEVKVEIVQTRDPVVRR